jgi:ABC-type multidrug transport system fused ATPase/permease subunit
MSQQDLWAVVGRARTDEEFTSQLFRDFEGAIRAGGYSLTPDEVQKAKDGLSDTSGPQAQAIFPLAEMKDSFKLQQDEMWKRIKAQNARMIDLNQFTANTLKETIGHSASTYKKVTLMNQVMFWMGVSLFIFAVVYAAVFRNLTYSGAFAGLGTVSFVGFFFLGPIQKTQVALSNLIQAEIAFMTYFEQMSLLESYAGMPRDNAPGLLDPVRIERASELFQQRAQQTIELLQKYLEDEPKRAEMSAKRRKDTVAAG